MLAFFQRLREGREPFENIDLYFPFYVEAGNTVTTGQGKRYKFPERKVFETIDAMIAYVKTHDNDKSMLMEDGEDDE